MTISTVAALVLAVAILDRMPDRAALCTQRRLTQGAIEVSSHHSPGPTHELFGKTRRIARLDRCAPVWRRYLDTTVRFVTVIRAGRNRP